MLYLLLLLSLHIIIQVFWSDSGELVCVSADDSFYILQYNAEAIQTAVSTNQGIDDDGIESAFDVSVSIYLCLLLVY